jgi:tRNA nucleotidyltransferase (CCA-adding enzyme)
LAATLRTRIESALRGSAGSEIELPRALLERAAELGLGGRALRDVWVDPPPAPPRDAPSRLQLPAAEPACSLARLVARAAARRGCRAWLVGGPVRDLLLGRPLGDLDVAVDGSAAALARQLARVDGGEVRVHARFGTAAVNWADGRRVDLAGLRSERYPRPAALPVVGPADLPTDLARRDFTVNTCALRLTVRGEGALTAPPGAHADLRDGVLRVLHGLSFVDDPTRAFRAARFAGRLGFRPSRATAHLVAVARSLDLFALLSPARLRREVEALLDERPVAPGLRWLHRLGLDTALHPALRIDAGRVGAVVRVERAHDTLGALVPGELRRGDSLLVALLDGLGPAARRSMIERLAPTRRTRLVLEQAASARRRLERALSWARMGDGRIHALCAPERGETLLLAAALGADRRVGKRVRRYLGKLRGQQADIDGHDLLAAGVAPGPDVARGLAAALRAKLEGKAPTRGAQLRVALRVRGSA